MPPLGPKEGENTDVREGEDSACLNTGSPDGVGGTICRTLLLKDLSSPGVRMVRLAGRRRAFLTGAWIGDGGAERWCSEVRSRIDEVAIGGRDLDGGGTVTDRFLRFRARLLGDSDRAGFGGPGIASVVLSFGAVGTI